jgi:hypothetical protein
LKHQERASSARLKQSAEDLITKLKSILIESINQLIGIPLQTKMLADIFIDSKEKDFSKLDIANIADLYNAFIDTKVRIQFEEKSNVKIDQLHKKLKQLFVLAREEFIADHLSLSSRVIFGHEDMGDFELNDEKAQEVLDYGVVVNFSANKTPTFLHQSFAEFFLAQSSFNKIDLGKDTELEQILREQRHFLIRRFLNDLIEKQPQQSHKPQQQTNENDLKKTRKYMKKITKTI